MHLRHVGVLVVAALLACVDVVPATTSSETKSHNFIARSLAENRNDILPTRLLRTSHPQDEEERVYGLEKVTQAISSAKFKLTINQNIRTWVKKGENADSAFTLLQLDNRAEHVLSSKNIKSWSKFISAYNAKNPSNQVSMIDLLTKRFGEAAISKMLVSAKNVKGTKKLATKLQAAQVAGWINKETPVRTVFKILKLDDKDMNPLGSRNFEAFANYLGVFNSRNPGKETTMLQVFTNVYGGEKSLVNWLQRVRDWPGAAAKGDELEAALFKKWSDAKLSVTNVVKDVLGPKDWYSYSTLLHRYGAFLKTEQKLRNAVPTRA